VDPCWQYLSSEPEVTFVRVETLDDLVSYMHYLPGSPYTVDGTGYIFPAPDGIRLARFDADLPEVLVVPLEFEARFAVWSPFNDRISIIDGDRRLWVAEVVAPDLPVVVVAESEIHE